MGKRYLSLGAVGVLTNRDVREAVQPVAYAPAAAPDASSSLVPAQKRPASALQSSAELSDNLSRNKRLKLALHARDEEVSTAERMKSLDMSKYWHQRYRLWSKFDQGIKMDKEGWWSVTPEAIAAHTAKRLRSGLVVDAFAGCGGNAIQLAFTCERVIAIDVNEFRLACAAHNAEVYGVADRITFIHADFFSWATAYASDPHSQPISTVFLSPPWGGMDYLSVAQDYPLSALQPKSGQDLFQAARVLSPNLALFLPKNTNLKELAELDDKVEVEEVLMSGKLKAVNVYYGDLVKDAQTEES